jgi:hypothetical protein
MRNAGLATPTLLAALLLTPLSVAWGKSWCARPLIVHEWGVQVFDANGAASGSRARVTLPSHFHAQAGAATSAARVSDLPPDSGERDLPIMHFYAREGDDRIPIGLAVGFAEGAATRWYPQVDAFRQEQAANSPAALQIRLGLVKARSELKPFGVRPRLPDDPTRQLQWNSLTLTRTPLHPSPSTDVDWVGQARALKETLWVNGATESERFVFFEAKTRERVALKLLRGNRYTDTFRHYILRNTSAFPVHDVFVVHREGNALFVFQAPSIPAGASAGFALEEHRVAVADQGARTRVALRNQLVAVRNEGSTCVMGRDPARPVESSSDHTLFADEAEALLRVWGTALFDQPGTTIAYREDRAYLDQAMPLSLFTDMFHWVELHRAGLALWQGIVLP